MSDFLTVEDINTTINKYGARGTLHEINTGLITDNDTDYTNVKYDFVKVSRTKNSSNYTFTFEVFNPRWIGPYYFKQTNGTYITSDGSYSDGKITFTTSYDNVVLVLYCTSLHGWYEFYRAFDHPYPFDLTNDTTLDRIDRWENSVPTLNLETGNISYSSIHYRNGIFDWGHPGSYLYYYIGRLVKSDFVFNCTQSLKLGQINRVALGTDTDYKPNGDMIGDNTPIIKVIYNNQTSYAEYDADDYYFNLDLTEVTEPSKIRFKVIIEANDVINATETGVTLQSDYETINTLNALKTFIQNGGYGKLGSNITLNSNLTINKNIYLDGNNKTLNLNGYQLIINNGKTFKAENTTFTNGVNAIHQKLDSKTEFTECTFTSNTGLGSCIECDIQLHSLDDPDDFNTILTNCTFTGNDLCILHGGNLQVTGCNVTGKIGDNDYAYFLYQTDGNAFIKQSVFSISEDSRISTDIKFNSCIFTIGESAQVNGQSHTEYQNNNILEFLETPYNNQSSIDLTYYYDLIEDYIRLYSDKGYCHSVSSVDYVFKDNVTVTREQ